MMQTLFQDVRYSIRMMLKNPGFTGAAVLTLAVGIGANTVIFCVAKGLMYPPLPYRDAGAILNLFESHLAHGGFGSSIPDYLDWKEQNHVFEQMAAVSYGWSTISGGAEPEDVDTAFVSDGFFELLGGAPLVGRLFLPEEYRPGGEPVMLLSYSFWQRQFGGRPDALGRQLTLSGEGYTVVGIMPPGFEVPFYTKAFLPLNARKDSIPKDRTNRRSGVFARLKPGVALTQARREMSVIAKGLEAAYPASNTDIAVNVLSWRERSYSRFQVMIALLVGAVAFVLLIGCANVANLLMARATSRQKEIAIRLSIGARRLRLIRQLLTESLVLAMLGGMLGVLLAVWSIPVLNSFSAFPHPFAIDIGILALTFTLVGITALLFGCIPAFLLARLGLSEVLKDKATRSGSMRSHRFRNALVVGELTLSLVLLYGAALLIQSFLRYEFLEKGFDPHNVLNVVVNVYKDRYPRGAQVADFGRDVLANLEHLPGGESGALATPISLKSRSGSWGIAIAGGSTDQAGIAPVIDPLAISSDYFRVMKISLLLGRPFTRQEAEQGTPIAILSEKLAQRLWPGEDPIGKTLRLETVESGMPWHSVVGIAREARGHSFPSAGTEALGLYVPFGVLRVGEGSFTRLGGNRDGRYTSLRFYLRTANDPRSQTGAVRAAISKVDNQQPIFAVRTMEEKLYQEGSPRRALAALTGVFAVIALLLATVGTYGVMAYSVSERTPEIGIRMALGAQRSDALVLVLKQGMRLLLTGLSLGLAGAVALSSVLQSQLFGVSAGDPVTLVGVSLLLAAVALLASYIPARRAANVDPMVALRYE